MPLILTLGIALILQNGGLLGSVGAGLDPDAASIRPGNSVRSSTSALRNKAGGIDAVVSFATMILLTLLITRSRIGKSLRAAADNPPRQPIWDRR